MGGALTGGLHGNHDAVPTSQQQANGIQASNNPCQFEFEQFVQCAQNESDISYCKGFNEVLKQCKADHGKMFQTCVFSKTWIFLNMFVLFIGMIWSCQNKIGSS